MKKLFLFTLPFLILMFTPLYVSAEAVPSISSQTYAVIQGGLDSLNSSSLSSYGVLPFNSSGVTETISHYVGFDMMLKPSDYVIRPLTVLEQEDLSSGFSTHFYDSEGNEISIDNLYFVNGVNDYYSTSFYIDNNGNVLYSDPYHQNTLLSVGINDITFPLITGSENWNWDDVYQNLAFQIANNAYNYYPEEEDFIENTYYLFFGSDNSSGKPLYSAYVYIPNQWVPGLIEPIATNPSNNGYIKSWYTNDPSYITCVQNLGDPRNFINVYEGNYNVSGYNYNYRVELTVTSPVYRQDVSYSDFLSGNYTPSSMHGFIFESNSYYYGTQIFHSAGVYRKAHMLEQPSISPGEMYDYDELQLTNTQLQPEQDINFDPSAAISPSNYPIIYPNPYGVINPGINPLPGVNPGVNPYPFPDSDPLINIENDPIGSSVPLINNLFRRFPFSIPWDLSRIVTGFVISPVPPAWDFDYSITVWGHTYTTHFQGDLSAFNSLAEILRILELIAFLIFLCFISYKYFF